MQKNCETRTVNPIQSSRCLHLTIRHFRESQQTIPPEPPTEPELVLRCSPERRSVPPAQSHRRNSDADPLVRRVPLARTRVCREVFALRSQIETLQRETSLSNTWIVTTMSLPTMSVIFIVKLRGRLQSKMGGNERCRFPDFRTNRLALRRQLRDDFLVFI